MVEIDLKRSLIATLVLFVLVEAFYMLGGRIPYIGMLPGDIAVKQGNTVLIVPLASSLVLSVVLSLVWNLIDRSRD